MECLNNIDHHVFFSSRRRHTRYWRDWSSDVCSSDLRKVFLILDRLKVHRARLTRDWLAAHWAEIEVVYLPSYSPELNPDEGVNVVWLGQAGGLCARWLRRSQSVPLRVNPASALCRDPLQPPVVAGPDAV